MNTLQTQAILPAKTPTSVAEQSTVSAEKPSAQTQQLANKSDRYSSTAANDAVVAKVLSFSLNKSVEQSVASEKQPSNNSLSDKFKVAQVESAPNFDIETVTQNIVGFVGKALANLAGQGYEDDKLEYFKNQAIVGVEVGIDQAKIELIGIADESVFDTIDNTRDLIIGGIKSLPNTKEDFLLNAELLKQANSGTDENLNKIELRSQTSSARAIDFNANLFSESKDALTSSKLFTTSASNISFAIEGSFNKDNSQAIADLVNQVDGLANSFYRGDVEASYTKATDQGFSDKDLLNLAKAQRQTEQTPTTQAYNDVQGINNADSANDLSAPKAVAEYLNRYLDVLETNNNVLEDEQDFKQIINGLVNQMKDVQVPDLLQAINRFHTFNSKFG
jgi:hypothetical protein